MNDAEFYLRGLMDALPDAEVVVSVRALASADGVDEFIPFDINDKAVWIGRLLKHYGFKRVHRRDGNCYLLSRRIVKKVVDGFANKVSALQTPESSEIVKGVGVEPSESERY